MDQHGYTRNMARLWVLTLLGTAYSSLLYYQRTLTGTIKVDGIIGVVFGLYICSHPAANVVDLLFSGRGGRRAFSSTRSAVFWVGLNVLVLLVGWIVIFFGTTRLVGRPAAFF